MRLQLFITILAAFFVSGCAGQASTSSASKTQSQTGPVDLETVLNLRSRDEAVFQAALDKIEASWDDGLVAPMLDISPLVSPQWRHVPIEKIKELTKFDFGTVDQLYSWYWSQDKRPPAWYPTLKAEANAHIDPRFKEYFSIDRVSKIDLTEVRWGGVKRDGIPPLDHPKMLSAKDATYLADTDVVFGIIHKGDARAYPKRILAYHEMFRDEIGREAIAGVYCTLCGSMIPYLSEGYKIGTSGYLYRSNKLMYDAKTKSLWSTLEGKPVVGPLVDKGIQLKSIPVITTTWGDWKKTHPTTTVLSLDTGHKRDYGEGVAYGSYFGTDKLMFGVEKIDKRLLNKDEVLIVRVPGKPLAMASKFLNENQVYHDKIGETNFVVLTSPEGANRVYRVSDQNFKTMKESQLTDSSGKTWTVTEDALLGADGQKLERLPSHRAFWFGWYAAHPDTRLVK